MANEEKPLNPKDNPRMFYTDLDQIVFLDKKAVAEARAREKKRRQQNKRKIGFNR